jgi:hypothetical protein
MNSGVLHLILDRGAVSAVSIVDLVSDNAIEESVSAISLGIMASRKNQVETKLTCHCRYCHDRRRSRWKQVTTENRWERLRLRRRPEVAQMRNTTNRAAPGSLPVHQSKAQDGQHLRYRRSSARRTSKAHDAPMSIVENAKSRIHS